MAALTDAVKEALTGGNLAAAATKIQEYLEKEKNTPLNIAVTGETGSGKSSFVNAFRGIKNKHEGAAPTGVVETTKKVTPYPHPNYPNVTLWDCPGIGTTKFPADKYLELVGFEKFDFFIIVSADRFRENDATLAQEIQKMKKKFYFVRSKIDQNLKDEEENQSENQTLECIRKNCTDELGKLHIKSAQVFLVSSRAFQLYDFSRLHETIEKELPDHKRNALLFAIPNISKEIISKKKEAFVSKIKYYAFLSAAGAAVPVPGLSAVVDLNLICDVVSDYVQAFGLDIQSLQKLSTRTGVPFKDFISVIISSVAAVDLSPVLLLKVIAQLSGIIGLMGAEEATRLIPIIGIPVAMGLSFTTTYTILQHFINILANDAEEVFKMALKINTTQHS